MRLRTSLHPSLPRMTDKRCEGDQLGDCLRLHLSARDNTATTTIRVLNSGRRVGRVVACQQFTASAAVILVHVPRPRYR